MDKKIILCTNSDIGRVGKVGYRTTQVANEILKSKKLEKIFCRRNYDKALSEYAISSIWYNFLNLSLNFVHQFILPFFHVRNYLDNYFDDFCLKELKKLDLNSNEYILHTWEPLEKTLKFAKENNIKVVLDVQMAYDLPKDSMKKINSLVDVLIVPSNYAMKMAVYVGFDNKKIQVIPFGVDISFYFEKNLDKVLKKKEFIVIFSGQLIFRKGIDVLIRSWQLAKIPNGKLIFAGRSHKESDDYIRKLTENDNSIEFVGNLSKEELRDYYLKASIFVLPTFLEGSAKVTYEAMASGLPVITTKEAGSIITDGVDGFIIKKGDIIDLKEKIEYFHKDLSRISKFGANGKRNVSKYTWQNYAKNIDKVYKKF